MELSLPLAIASSQDLLGAAEKLRALPGHRSLWGDPVHGGGLYFASVPERQALFPPSFHDFTILAGHTATPREVLPKFAQLGPRFHCFCMSGTRAARATARFKNGTWRLGYSKIWPNPAAADAFLMDVIQKLPLPIRPVGSDPKRYEHTEGGDLVIPALGGTGFSCELRGADVEQILAGMDKLLPMLAVSAPDYQSFTVDPYQPDPATDAAPLYDEVVRAGLPSHRATVLYKFALPGAELSRLHELCRQDKDYFNVKLCSFRLLDLDARLEVRIKKAGFEPIFVAQPTAALDESRGKELKAAICSSTGLSFPS